MTVAANRLPFSDLSQVRVVEVYALENSTSPRLSETLHLANLSRSYTFCEKLVGNVTLIPLEVAGKTTDYGWCPRCLSQLRTIRAALSRRPSTGREKIDEGTRRIIVRMVNEGMQRKVVMKQLGVSESLIAKVMREYRARTGTRGRRTAGSQAR